MKHSFWHLDLFGGLRAVRIDQTATPPIENFRTQKAAALLAFLAFYRQAHRREVLAEMFWPDADAHKARNSLRVALSGLREQLETKGAPETGALVIKRESLALAASVTTDVTLFRSRLQEAHFEVEENLRLEKLEAAVQLVRGPLLRGFYDDWISGEAARLEDEFLSALRQIITTHERQGDLLKALDAARRGAIAAPLREGVMRELVRLGIACGQDETVKGEFEAFRRRIERVGGARAIEWNEFVLRATQNPAARNVVSGIEAGALPKANMAVQNGSAGSTAVPPPTEPASWQPTGDTIRPLPTTTSSFVGRTRDIEALTELLGAAATRMVTLVGPGGAGKTRLALETVGKLPRTTQEKTPDTLRFNAVVWLPLANLPSSRLLPGALLDALGAPAFKEDIESVALILRQLSDRQTSEVSQSVAPAALPSLVEPRLLLVVDNCEHLGKNAAVFINDLLARIPNLTVLATSRAPLGLGGEQLYPLGSLDAPALLPELATPHDDAARAATDLANAPSDAMRLFVERARQAQKNFDLTPENAALLNRICIRLDGLPLAIEIAAARVAQFPLEHIATGLGVALPAEVAVSQSWLDAAAEGENVNSLPEALLKLSQGAAPSAEDLIRSLGLLDWSNGSAQSPTRHSSLRTAIEWSTELLSPAIAQFWARLSVFRESFSLEAVTEVCEEPYATIYVQTLRDASLLSGPASNLTLSSAVSPSTEGTREAVRGVWLHALREFAAETLPPEAKSRLEARHADYFLRWAVQLSPLLDNPTSTREQHLLEAEAVNLRTALDWLLEHDVEGAIRFVNALCWHWEQAGHLVEGRLALETALEKSQAMFAALEPLVQPGEEDPGTEALDARQRLRERAQALEGLGKMGNMVAAQDTEVHLAEALRLFRLLNDEVSIASCLYALGFNALRRGDQDTARRLCQESLEMIRQRPDPIVLADSLYNLSMVALVSGDYPMVRRLNAERLTLCRLNGDKRGVGISLENLGLAALFEGERAAAATYFSESLMAFEALEDKPSIARALWGLGQVALHGERFAEARDHFLRALTLLRATHNLWAMPYIVESFGALAVAQGQLERAAQLLAGAAGLRERQREPITAPQYRQEFERLCDATRTALGEANFVRLWRQGHNLERTHLLNLAESSPE